jgi:Ala-tRNA(Pro) deacylase
MSIPSRLSSYLDQRGARYEICAHELSHSSAETARAAHVLPHQLAKSVILEVDTGCVMAVVPADKIRRRRNSGDPEGRRNTQLSIRKSWPRQ